MTKTEKEEMIAKLRDWIASPEGQAKMAEIGEACKKMREELNKQGQVSWEDLYKPMDF